MKHNLKRMISLLLLITLLIQPMSVFADEYYETSGESSNMNGYEAGGTYNAEPASLYGYRVIIVNATEFMGPNTENTMKNAFKYVLTKDSGTKPFNYFNIVNNWNSFKDIVFVKDSILNSLNEIYVYYSKDKWVTFNTKDDGGATIYDRWTTYTSLLNNPSSVLASSYSRAKDAIGTSYLVDGGWEKYVDDDIATSKSLSDLTSIASAYHNTRFTNDTSNWNENTLTIGWYCLLRMICSKMTANVDLAKRALDAYRTNKNQDGSLYYVFIEEYGFSGCRKAGIFSNYAIWCSLMGSGSSQYYWSLGGDNYEYKDVNTYRKNVLTFIQNNMGVVANLNAIGYPTIGWGQVAGPMTRSTANSWHLERYDTGDRKLHLLNEASAWKGEQNTMFRSVSALKNGDDPNETALPARGLSAPDKTPDPTTPSVKVSLEMTVKNDLSSTTITLNKATNTYEVTNKADKEGDPDVVTKNLSLAQVVPLIKLSSRGTIKFNDPPSTDDKTKTLKEALSGLKSDAVITLTLTFAQCDLTNNIRTYNLKNFVINDKADWDKTIKNTEVKPQGNTVTITMPRDVAIKQFLDKQATIDFDIEAKANNFTTEAGGKYGKVNLFLTATWTYKDVNGRDVSVVAIGEGAMTHKKGGTAHGNGSGELQAEDFSSWRWTGITPTPTPTVITPTPPITSPVTVTPTITLTPTPTATPTPTPTPTPEPWDFHSTADVVFYSELKANECKNEDWEVLAGIASTENTFVASGGELYQVDVEGIYDFQADIKRLITFNVTTTDGWGKNEPCDLSCGGHTGPTTTCSSGETAGCATHGTPFNCDHCGGTFSAPCNEVKEEKDEEGEIITEYQACDAETTHSCSFYATFDCSDGTGGGGGASYNNNTVTSSLVNNQHYIGTTIATCKAGCTAECTFDTDTIIDYGYTNGKGCACNNTNNANHPKEKKHTFYIKENINEIWFLNIENYAVYGLLKTEITDINSSVMEDSVLNQSSVHNMTVEAFDIQEKGYYESGNGRIYFTKFKDPLHKGNGDGYTSATSRNYWLGDCTITITGVMDKKETAGSAGVLKDYDFSHTRGHEEGTWESAEGDDEYSGHEYKGDYSETDEDYLNNNLAIVNSWLWFNNGGDGDQLKYTGIVVSDSLCIGFDEYFQNIVAGVYPVDKGLPICGKGFSSANEIIEYDHKGIKPTADQLNDVITNSSPYAYRSLTGEKGVLKFGYQGTISDDYSRRYPEPSSGVKYHSEGGHLTHSLQSTRLLMLVYTKNWGDDQAKWTNADYSVWYGNINRDSLSYIDKSSIFEWNATIIGNENSESFEGYYETHNYNTVNKASPFTLDITYNEYTGIGNTTTVTKASDLTGGNKGTNSGKLNTERYGFPYVISNLDLKDLAPNKIYNQPVTVKAYFPLVVNKQETIKKSEWPERETEFTGRYYKNYTNTKGTRNVINDLVIHTPVSNQYSHVIGNQTTMTDPGDQRVGTHTENFWVVNNNFSIWISDLGDFYDSSGQAGIASATNNKGIGNSGSACSLSSLTPYTTGSGFMNSMYTNRWVRDRYVKLPAAVSYYSLSQGRTISVEANEWINLKDVKTKSGLTMYPYNDGNAKGLGYEYEFKLLTSMMEAKGTEVQFLTTAINNPKSGITDNNYNNINFDRYSYEADHDVYNKSKVDLVGRIGNLAIEDTGDFRFSELFKKPLSTWLIPGVIHKVDVSTPNAVVSTPKNIFLEPATDSVYNHTSLSITYQNLNSTLLGKAGKYYNLPLNPKQNPLKEYQQDPMKPGYNLYMDIETVGNYYGINFKENTLAYEDDDSFTRDKVMKITSYYWLLNLDTGKFTPIDIYYGEKGNRKLCYKFGALIDSDFRLYVSLKDEAERRNIGQSENLLTRSIADRTRSTIHPYDYTTDYIGTPSQIILDQRNRTFIGSSVMYGGLSFNGSNYSVLSTNSKTIWQNSKNLNMNANNYDDGDLLEEYSFTQQSQRWHFTLGLPSTSYIVPTGTYASQQAIDSAHDALKTSNPNSVIVCAIDFHIQGDVWALRYDARKLNTVDSTGKVPFQVYDDTNYYLPSGYEDKQVVVTYDPWNTSAQDLSTVGTH